MIKQFKKGLINEFESLKNYYLEFKEVENMFKIRITTPDKMRVYPLNLTENEFLLNNRSITPEELFKDFIGGKK